MNEKDRLNTNNEKITIDDFYYYYLLKCENNINKAIEYIENNTELYYGDELYDEYQKIVDILKGSDKE